MATKLDPIIDVNVNEYSQPAPTPPAIQILPPSVEYDFSFHRGYDTWTFIVQAMVAYTADYSSQRLLDDMMSTGPMSIKTLLEADQTLNGTTASVLCTRHDFRGKVETAGGSPMLLVEFTVEVIAGGT